MKPRRYHWLTAVSVALNFILVTAIIAAWTKSSVLRLHLHEALAARFGKTEIVFIGDSLTREGGVWERRLGSPLLSTRNLGHSALYVEQLKYQAHLAVASGATTAYVMGGTNDAQRPTASVGETHAHYVDVLRILEDGGIQPVIQSTLFRGDGKYAEFISGLNDRLREHARKRGFAYIDLNAKLAPNGTLEIAYSRDGIHLTEAGYQVWADLLKSSSRKN